DQPRECANPRNTASPSNADLQSSQHLESQRLPVGNPQRFKKDESRSSPYLAAPADPASPIARIQDYVMANVGRRHTLQSLAAEVGMSARNLARHFVQETGITPHEFVERARIDAARMLLEGSDRALKAIAYDCGFGTADRMRIVFSKRFGVTPAQYRASFHQSTATSEAAGVP
ncbi:MAG: helix-turn-helix domain-containing protein, partial [Alphaproteobacteria bacterium]|nr:helix-turn-helix domain-containing protein [Alphaproteobacteria bacterium]